MVAVVIGSCRDAPALWQVRGMSIVFSAIPFPGSREAQGSAPVYVVWLQSLDNLPCMGLLSYFLAVIGISLTGLLVGSTSSPPSD